MGERERRLDEVRARRTPLENHLIDELRAGKIGRREFIRRGTVVGMSVPMLGFIASACGVTREDLEQVDPPQTGQARSPAGRSAAACSGRPARSTR